MPKYEVIIYWSKTDGAFVAEVPELPGCVADGPPRQRRSPTPRSSSVSGLKPPSRSVAQSRHPVAGSRSPDTVSQSKIETPNSKIAALPATGLGY